MRISRIQDIAIFLLVLLTFFQTGELWFGGTPNHNFFYSFFSADTGVVSSESLAALSHPYRIVTSTPQKGYQIKYTAIADSEQKKLLDEAVPVLLKDGVYMGVSAVDWSVLETSLLYEYACSIPAEAFTASYGQKSNVLATRCETFDKILLVPGVGSYVSPMILFVDEPANICHTFRLDRSDLTAKINAARETFTVTNDQITYIASSTLPVDLFSRHVFIATWSGDTLNCTDVEKINPYAGNGGVLKDTIENQINIFFNNPARKQYTAPKEPGNVFTFSDETTVVKYHPSNVLECLNYKAADENRTTTFASAFSAAVEFIGRDTTITPADEYYLVSCAPNADGDWVLAFDFAVCDLPVFLSGRASNQPELNHAIEITVSHDLVTKYTRYAFLYRPLDSAESGASVKGVEALDSAVLNFGVGDEETKNLIRSVDIGYNIDNSDSVSLYWYVGYNGVDSNYSFSAN